MRTIDERIKNNLYYEAYKILLTKKKNIKKFEQILKYTKFLERIGNESKYGEIFKGIINTNDNETEISIKKIPLSLKDLKIFLLNQENDESIIFNTKTIWREIYVLQLCSKLIRSKLCINLPLHNFYVYSSSNIYTKNISQNLPYVYCYNELAHEDLKSWSSKERNYKEWISCFLQIFFSIYVMQYYYGFLHNDLHWANILVFHIKKGGYWTYVIDEKRYNILNEGFLFVLWDFGMVSLQNSLKKCGNDIKACQDFLKILNTPKWIKKHYPSVVIPKEICDLCLYIRSHEYKNMNDILTKIIKKFSKDSNKLKNNEEVLETFEIK